MPRRCASVAGASAIPRYGRTTRPNLRICVFCVRVCVRVFVCSCRLIVHVCGDYLDCRRAEDRRQPHTQSSFQNTNTAALLAAHAPAARCRPLDLSMGMAKPTPLLARTCSRTVHTAHTTHTAHIAHMCVHDKHNTHSTQITHTPAAPGPWRCQWEWQSRRRCWTPILTGWRC